MKLHPKAFWIAASVWLLVLCACAPRLSLAADVTAAENCYNPNISAPVAVTPSPAGPILLFTSYSGAFGTENVRPISGWSQRVPANERIRYSAADIAAGNNVLWGRMVFDRNQIGSTPLAIYTLGNRDQFKVTVNGRELFRNYVSTSDLVQSWYYPFLIPVPPETLKDGTNEIIFQNSGWQDAAVGCVYIGPQEVLKNTYALQKLIRINGPIMANVMMAFLGVCALLLWTVRRTEHELLYLGLMAAFWLVRDHHFYTSNIPIDPALYQGLMHVSLYFAAAASASFGLTFLKTPNRQRIIIGMFAYGVVISSLEAMFPISPFFIMIPSFLIAFMTSIYGAIGVTKTRSLDHLVVSLAMASIIISSAHDFGRNQSIWDGVGFYFQPYVGFFFASVFLVSFGRRAQRAFVDQGSANETLGLRIAQVKHDLESSETNRRELEVGQALAKERLRLMQEMHDGIGSNLVTALAIAQNQKHSAETVRTLSRALSDLKITVDSLEPVNGDIVILIANLRHRMANDLRQAGLTCAWEAKECPPLTWLDATGALHIVRIFQEALSNVIEHARATTVRIGCYEETREGIGGVTAFVADNGIGFCDVSCVQGKGIANMRSRASSINAVFSCDSQLGTGAYLSVWLPLVVRDARA